MLENITVTDVTDVFNVFSPKGVCNEIQNQSSFGLSFCVEGRITYTHNGKTVVSDPEHAVILPQNRSYSLHGDVTGNFAVINFKCLEPLCDTVISVPTERGNENFREFEKLRSLYLFAKNRAEVFSVFYHILHRISVQSIPNGVILPAVQYIQNTFDDPNMTVEELAALCNISASYFRRIFTESYGVSPKRFLTDIRINKAKQLLAEGVLKINTVAESCGFSNQYHFCRLFKERTGMTPTEYMSGNRF